MKWNHTKLTGAALALVLFAGLALAQGPGGPHHEGDMFGHMMGMFSDMLDLTDAQQAQIKQIHENAKPTIEPLLRQERQSHHAMMQLITGGSFDQAKAQAIANQESQIHAQLEVQHAVMAAQAYQVLTAEQKAKFNDFLARREQRFEKRMQERQTNPAPTPNQ